MYTTSLDSHYLNSVTAVPIKTTQWLDLFQSAKYETHAKEHLEMGKNCAQHNATKKVKLPKVKVTYYRKKNFFIFQELHYRKQSNFH